MCLAINSSHRFPSRFKQPLHKGESSSTFCKYYINCGNATTDICVLHKKCFLQFFSINGTTKVENMLIEKSLIKTAPLLKNNKNILLGDNEKKTYFKDFNFNIILFFSPQDDNSVFRHLPMNVLSIVISTIKQQDINFDVMPYLNLFVQL